MSTPVLVQTAALAPGVCFLSGDHNGPFLDTGKDVRGLGRVYLSLKALGPLLRECGWVELHEVETELALVTDYQDQLAAGERAQEAYAQFVEAVSPLLPTPEPVIVDRAVFLDDGVRQDNERLRMEADSLRLELHDANVALKAASKVADPAPTSEGSAPVEPGSAPQPLIVEVFDAEVNVGDLLSRTAEEVISIIDNWPDDALDVVQEAEAAGKGRKTILAACA